MLYPTVFLSFIRYLTNAQYLISNASTASKTILNIAINFMYKSWLTLEKICTESIKVNCSDNYYSHFLRHSYKQAQQPTYLAI